jgi:hypothetical protein
MYSRYRYHLVHGDRIFVRKGRVAQRTYASRGDPKVLLVRDAATNIDITEKSPNQHRELFRDSRVVRPIQEIRGCRKTLTTSKHKLK